MISIRQPHREEESAWLPLWGEYLDFYGEPLSGTIARLTLQRFHDPGEPLWLLCAYSDDAMIGFVAYLFHRSTWAFRHYCYLEDLFVASDHRSQGVARRLIEAVAAAAAEAGSERLYWVTRANNTTAQALYDRLAEKTDFVQYRMPLDSRA